MITFCSSSLHQLPMLAELLQDVAEIARLAGGHGETKLLAVSH